MIFAKITTSGTGRHWATIVDKVQTGIFLTSRVGVLEIAQDQLAEAQKLVGQKLEGFRMEAPNEDGVYKVVPA